MASLFEKILKSVNSGVPIEEALAKFGTNQQVLDELLEGVTTDTTASAGAQTLPSNPSGFLEFTVNGSIIKVPYYDD